eukprot:TRINITY_DN21222_c0_g2_i1.p2 TRINITY_DN21222_c0_g2~~TRINITY_DN21222_c0_g2_i1.p2  ORF type:complete len:175 (+),score=5.12 TRINITY_DN21222_c0_g2_i1:31-555(+)
MSFIATKPSQLLQVECNVVQHNRGSGFLVRYGDGHEAAGMERELTELKLADKDRQLARFRSATEKRVAERTMMQQRAKQVAEEESVLSQRKREANLRLCRSKYITRSSGTPHSPQECLVMAPRGARLVLSDSASDHPLQDPQPFGCAKRQLPTQCATKTFISRSREALRELPTN